MKKLLPILLLLPLLVSGQGQVAFKNLPAITTIHGTDLVLLDQIATYPSPTQFTPTPGVATVSQLASFIGGGGGSGTVTSVAVTVPSFLTIAGSPVTTSGTLAIGLSGTALPVANGGTGATTLAGANLPIFNGAITSGHCAEWLNSTTLEDSGAGCGSGGSTAFSALTGSTNTTAAMLVGSGASLGTTGSGTITATAAPLAGISGLGTGIATFLATPSSANLASAVTGETGTGALVFGTSPSFTTGVTFGFVTGSTQCLQVNTSGVLSGTGSACGSGGSTAFSALTGSTNTTAAMVVGTGASLATSGSGTITATAAPFSGLSASTNSSAAMVVGTGASLATSGSGTIAATSVTTLGGLPTIATQTVLGNGSGSTAAPAALTLGTNLVATAGALNLTAPNRTVTTSPTVLSTDMGGQVNSNVTGGGTLTIPAISSTVFPAGGTLTVVNYSASTEAVSTTPTVNAGGGCVTGTGIPAGDTWNLVSNGTTLDCNQTISAGGGGSGTITPSTAGQIPVYTGSTTIAGGANFTISGGALTLGVSGTAGSVAMGNATSGVLTLQPVTGALGTVTASLPANTGTVAELNLAETWSALQTFGTNISIGGVTATGATGTGAVVFGTGPTLSAPVLGTPASGVMTNLTGTPSSIGLANATAGSLPLTAIATIANNTALANVSGSTASPSATSAANMTGLLNSPTCNPQTGTTYTTVLGDANICITMSNASANTLTIPPNASVAYPVGTTLTIEQIAAGLTTVAQGAGVTFTSLQYGSSTTINYPLAGIYDFIQLKQTATNTWLVTVVGPGRNTYTVDTGTKFTLGTGTGACATSSTLTGGATTGSFLCTGTLGASTQVINLPTAPHGWWCSGFDTNTTTPTVLGQVGPIATTTCKIQGTVTASSDVITFRAEAY